MTIDDGPNGAWFPVLQGFPVDFYWFFDSFALGFLILGILVHSWHFRHFYSLILGSTTRYRTSEMKVPISTSTAEMKFTVRITG